MTQPRRRTRPGRSSRALLAAVVAVAVAAGAVLAACGGATPTARTPGPPPTVRPTPSTTVEATFAQLQGALRAEGLALEPTLTDVRPAEPPSFAGVSRWPFHAVLPDDPAVGYFVIYEFADPAVAAAGGRDLATYVTSGPGRVQFPPDVRFVLRLVGSTLVFYPWSASSSADPKAPDVAAALDSVGSEVPIPRG